MITLNIYEVVIFASMLFFSVFFALDCLSIRRLKRENAVLRELNDELMRTLIESARSLTDGVSLLEGGDEEKNAGNAQEEGRR